MKAEKTLHTTLVNLAEITKYYERDVADRDAIVASLRQKISNDERELNRRAFQLKLSHSRVSELQKKSGNPVGVNETLLDENKALKESFEKFVKLAKKDREETEARVESVLKRKGEDLSSIQKFREINESVEAYINRYLERKAEKETEKEQTEKLTEVKLLYAEQLENLSNLLQENES